MRFGSSQLHILLFGVELVAVGFLSVIWLLFWHGCGVFVNLFVRKVMTGNVHTVVTGSHLAVASLRTICNFLSLNIIVFCFLFLKKLTSSISQFSFVSNR